MAQTRSAGDDVKKRLMVVPDVHVTRLVTAQRNGTTVVTAVLVKQFGVEQIDPVPEDGVVIIALGTIESTRLALISFPNLPNANLIGQNLMAHLRSNLTIRIPRSALPAGLPTALASSALFVKGKFQHAANDVGYFHLQITASGLDKPTTDSEAELFKKIPEVDLLDALRQTNDDNVVITIRGIGEMTPRNPASKITLSGNDSMSSGCRALSFRSIVRPAMRTCGTRWTRRRTTSRRCSRTGSRTRCSIRRRDLPRRSTSCSRPMPLPANCLRKAARHDGHDPSRGGAAVDRHQMPTTR